MNTQTRTLTAALAAFTVSLVAVGCSQTVGGLAQPDTSISVDTATQPTTSTMPTHVIPSKYEVIEQGVANATNDLGRAWRAYGVDFKGLGVQYLVDKAEAANATCSNADVGQGDAAWTCSDHTDTLDVYLPEALGIYNTDNAGSPALYVVIGHELGHMASHRNGNDDLASSEALADCLSGAINADAGAYDLGNLTNGARAANASGNTDARTQTFVYGYDHGVEACYSAAKAQGR